MDTHAARRYDVDWLRTATLGILIAYHALASFQPWAHFIAFPGYPTHLGWLWVPMEAVNIWRIPLLFLISGMGVRFAMERRSWRRLLGERSLRILLPYVFCTFGLGALFHFTLPPSLRLHFGHLWFLANIFLYTLVFLPLFVYLKNRPDRISLAPLCRAPHGLGLLVLALPFIAEAAIVGPQFYAMYFGNLHGLLLGALCFLTGFLAANTGAVFQQATVALRFTALALAAVLYLSRATVTGFQNTPNPLIALESVCWMLSVLGFAAKHLDRPSPALKTLGAAVFPVYIVHLPVQFTISHFLFPLELPAAAAFLILTATTLAASAALYHFAFRHTGPLRPLFGMRRKPETPSAICTQKSISS